MYDLFCQCALESKNERKISYRKERDRMIKAYEKNKKKVIHKKFKKALKKNYFGAIEETT